MTDCEVSVVIPAKNEAVSLAKLLPRIREAVPNAELIVVDDGSTDGTKDLLEKLSIKSVRHHVSKGNGAAIKAGARAATGDVIVFMDGDGQHDPQNIELLLAELNRGADLAVGSRSAEGQASLGRKLANGFYNWFASIVTGFPVKDLTSGFRAVNAKKFRSFLHLLPNGFSYPTTSTIAFLRSGFNVVYVPINVHKRIGRSHIRPVRDGLRFLLIIFKVSTLYSPLKVFLPIAVLSFLLGLLRYAYTYFAFDSFTNMSALLMVSAVQIFLIGLVSEQITSLIYKDK